MTVSDSKINPPNVASPKRKRTHKVAAHLELPGWPELPVAQVIRHASVPPVTKAGLRLNARQMRTCGLNPEAGLHITRFKDRLLVRNEGPGQVLKQKPNGMLHLGRRGLTPALFDGASVVEGLGYAVVTTPDDARKLAPGVLEADKAAWQRISVAPELLPYDLGALGDQVLGWKHVVRRKASTTKAVLPPVASGHLWAYAGFGVGAFLRFTRYRNATVIEPGTSVDHHSTLGFAITRARPRHYLGTSLCDFGDVDGYCMVALPGQIVITPKGSTLAELLPKERYEPREPQLPVCRLTDRPKKPLPYKPDFVLEGWLDRPVGYGGGVTLTKKLLTAAGIPHQAKLRTQREGGHIVVTSRDVPNSARSHDTLSRVTLNKIGLAQAESIRIFIAEGRLVIGSVESPLTSLCPAVTELEPLPRANHYQIPIGFPVLAALTEADVTPTAWEDYGVKRDRLQVWGVTWAAHGFPYGQPVRVQLHENALVLEACDESSMMFYVGSPSLSPIFRRILLTATPLSGVRCVRALFSLGRVVFVDAHGALADAINVSEILAHAKAAEPIARERARERRNNGKSSPAAELVATSTQTSVRWASSKGATRLSTKKAIQGAAVAHELGAEYFEVIGWLDHMAIKGQVTISGKALAAAGVGPNSGLTLEMYADALVLKLCKTRERMKFLDPEKKGYFNRQVPLRNTSLERENVVRVVITRHGVVLTAPHSAHELVCTSATRGVGFT